jgi:hypothetical protein
VSERIGGINELESLALRDKIGWTENIQTLIRLCYLAANDEYLFAQRVNLLLRSLPKAIKDSTEFWTMVENCTQEQPPKWAYRVWSGVRQGTPEHPVNGSPWLVEQPPTTDWSLIFECCIDELEKLGVTWQKDQKGGAT